MKVHDFAFLKGSRWNIAHFLAQYLPVEKQKSSFEIKMGARRQRSMSSLRLEDDVQQKLHQFPHIFY